MFKPIGEVTRQVVASLEPATTGGIRGGFGAEGSASEPATHRLIERGAIISLCEYRKRGGTSEFTESFMLPDGNPKPTRHGIRSGYATTAAGPSESVGGANKSGRRGTVTRRLPSTDIATRC